MTGNKGKRSPTHKMKTRSSAASTTTDNIDSLPSTDHTTDIATEGHSNVSQAMDDPVGSSSQSVTKAQPTTQSESTISAATSSASQASPNPNVVGSSTSSGFQTITQSGNTTNNVVVSWIRENYEPKENSNVPRSGIYVHYSHYCASQLVKPVNPATFGKLIRVAFPGMTTRRLGNRGQSKYQYCNIQRRETPENTNVPEGAASKTINTPSIPSTVATYGSSSQYQNPHDQPSNVQNPHDQLSSVQNPPSTSHSIVGNVGTLAPTMLNPYQGTEPTYLSTQHDLHGLPSLQLPLPFVPTSSSSNSPHLLPQHYLSNVELVSIFPPQQTASYQHDVSSSSPPRLLTSSSFPGVPSISSPGVPPISGPTMTPFAGFTPHETSASTSQFALEYNRHCMTIYNAVCAGEFEKLQPIYDNFYQQMPASYKSMVFTTPELTSFIWRTDCTLYDLFLTNILPKINSPISEEMENGLNSYTKNLPRYLKYLLTPYPANLRNKKYDVACVFVAKMRRHLTLNHFARKTEMILNQPIHLTEMRRDWETLDLGTILDHVLWVCECRNDDMEKILKTKIPQLLNSNSNFDHMMTWVDELIDKFVPISPKVQENQEDESFVNNSKKFVLNWRMYTSLVMQQLYVKDVPTIESFRQLHFFFDNVILFAVEKRIASVYSSTMQRPILFSTTMA